MATKPSTISTASTTDVARRDTAFNAALTVGVFISWVVLKTLLIRSIAKSIQAAREAA